MIIEKEKAVLVTMTNEAFMENACCNSSSSDSLNPIRYFEEKDAEIETYIQIVKNLSDTLEDIRVLSRANMLYSAQNTKNIYPGVLAEFNEDTIYKAFIVLCRFNSILPLSDDMLPLCNEKPEYLSLNDPIHEMIKKLKNNGKVYTNEMLLRLLQIANRNNMVYITLDTPEITQTQKMRDIIEFLSEEEDEVVETSLVEVIHKTLDNFDISTEEDTPDMRKLKNLLTTNNRLIKVELFEFLKKYSGQKLSTIDIFLTSMMNWGGSDDVEGDVTDGGELDDYDDSNTNNWIQFMQSYIQNFIKTFPNIIINEVDYDTIKIPEYLKLSGFHKQDLKKLISDYYVNLRPFYQDKSLTSILLAIQEKGKNLLILSKETPYFADIQQNEKILHSVFDKRTSKMLFEHYMLLTLLQYKTLAEDEGMLFSEDMEKETLENLFDVDEEYTPVATLQQEKSLNTLKSTISRLIIVYLNIMKDHKDQVSNSYKTVMDKIFKLQEREKNTFTDRLKSMTDQERDVDNVLKSNKLGAWSKGLQKGLTRYDKDTYDEERELMEKIAQEVNMDEEDIESAERGAEIEAEEYDMAHMTDDYDNGNYGEDEVDNYDDYE